MLKEVCILPPTSVSTSRGPSSEDLSPLADRPSPRPLLPCASQSASRLRAPEAPPLPRLPSRALGGSHRAIRHRRLLRRFLAGDLDDDGCDRGRTMFPKHGEDRLRPAVAPSASRGMMARGRPAPSRASPPRGKSVATKRRRRRADRTGPGRRSPCRVPTGPAEDAGRLDSGSDRSGSPPPGEAVDGRCSALAVRLVCPPPSTPRPPAK